MAEQVRVPKGVTKQEFLEAVRTGVRDPIWEMIATAPAPRAPISTLPSRTGLKLP